MTILGPGWSIQLKDGWEGEQEDEGIAMFHPDGVGTLQISTAHKEGEEVTAEELDDLAEDCAPASVKLLPLTIAGWEGKGASFVEDEDAWRVWCLRKGPYALFVTYECSVVDMGTEDADVDEMLKTLALTPSKNKRLH